MSKAKGHEPQSEHIEHNEPVSTEWSTHPGLLLKYEVLPDRGCSAAALADAIEVARPGFNNMLNGKRAITAPLALKIEAAIGYPADMLLRLQAAYELAEAKHEFADLVQRITEMSRNMFTKTVVANDHGSEKLKKLA